MFVRGYYDPPFLIYCGVHMTVPLRGNGFAVFYYGSLSRINTANNFSRVAAVPLYTYSKGHDFKLKQLQIKHTLCHTPFRFSKISDHFSYTLNNSFQ